MQITSRVMLFFTVAVAAGLLGLGCGGANSRLRTETPVSEPLTLTTAAEAWAALGLIEMQREVSNA